MAIRYLKIALVTFVGLQGLLYVAGNVANRDAAVGAVGYVLSPGLAMVVWFGGFIVIGGALFQMWQSEVGGNSFEGAFIYAITSGLIMLFVNSRDE